MKFVNKLYIFFGVFIFLSGCASNLTGDNYSAQEARKAQTVSYGVVTSARAVIIDGRQRGIVGTVGGAAVGGVLGNKIGGGSGRDLATALGAVAGAVIGQKIEESATRKQGQEITVKLDTGGTVSIVQQVNQGSFFSVNDRVRILEQGGTSRVSY
ncbi:MAG: glycine zipper 2TM domain-containing protein [Pseudomonadales bacterium]|nr:glycine zipper 2TM domain-containing protein [Pseudomonadales bacterium]NRA15990.1 glycine zipper 2TM domain-containing protein [Oceanospirillaceae bacterium]